MQTNECPACLVRLILIVFVMGGNWPYSCCSVGCCLKWPEKVWYTVKQNNWLNLSPQYLHLIFGCLLLKRNPFLFSNILFLAMSCIFVWNLFSLSLEISIQLFFFVFLIFVSFQLFFMLQGMLLAAVISFSLLFSLYFSCTGIEAFMQSSIMGYLLPNFS